MKAATLLLAPPIILAAFGGCIGVLIGHIAPEYYGAATASVGRRVGAAIGLGQGAVWGSVLAGILLSIALFRSAANPTKKALWPRYFAVGLFGFVVGGVAAGYIGWFIGSIESAINSQRVTTASAYHAITDLLADDTYPGIWVQDGKYSVSLRGDVDDDAHEEQLRHDVAQALGEVMMDRVDWYVTIAAPD